MRQVTVPCLLLLAACREATAPGAAPAVAEVHAPAPSQLRQPESFASIGDKEQRSRAFFLEASRVMLHPRCTNCHPADDSPRQLMTQRLHDPPVTRGPEDRGVPSMECASCHQDVNLALARVPGAPNWHLAPREAVWVGRTPDQICQQLKDVHRNGGKTLQQIVDHAAHDELVAWGWNPGHDREPAPGTQETYGRLMQGWLDTGASCPGGS